MRLIVFWLQNKPKLKVTLVYVSKDETEIGFYFLPNYIRTELLFGSSLPELNA
jgi:hypothetical protein